MSQKLHIISFDIPYPADYGGVIDVYYKAKALAEAGVKIYLHCFEYHRPPAPELEAFCEKVMYYPRRISGGLLFHKWPYIVISRQSDELLLNLQKNNWPVLIEGLHCTWLLNDRYWTNRKMIVRTHNIEHEYYRQLAKAEKNLFKKYYFLNESAKLETYEPVLANSSGIAAITEKEKEHFNKFHHYVKNIPAFHGHNKVMSKPGQGKYILYHGNLGVAENHKAACYIAETFAGSHHQVVIAGGAPRKELKELCAAGKNIMLIAHPSQEEMHSLIQNAQLHLLITFQGTGLKLKLLNALFNGRHCMVNKMMVEGTGLEDACIITDIDHKPGLSEQVDTYMNIPFTETDVHERDILLTDFYDRESAAKIMKMLFETL